MMNIKNTNLEINYLIQNFKDILIWRTRLKHIISKKI